MATSSIPPVPGQGGVDQGVSGLATPPQATPQPEQTDQQERTRAVLRQIRELMMGVEALSKQFPVAAKEGRNVSTALRGMMTAIVGDMNRSQESPPAPNVVG